MKILRPLIFSIALVLGFYLVTTHGSGAGFHLPFTESIARPTKIEITQAAAPPPLDPEEQNNISVYRRVIPAVVNITSTAVAFDFFYGPVPQQGQGSGFIIDGDGHILTNYHAIAGARQVEVTLSNKKKYRADVIGSDRQKDLAVLQIPAKNLTPAVLGDSKSLEVGQKVYAIGNPFGLSGTMTRGIISSIRSVRGPEGNAIDKAIQTDAAINPGNSGGAMIDLHGDLIGINTAILTGGGGGNQGIGFAIPINMARSVMDQIVSHGKVVRGYLGLLPQDVSPTLAKQFNVNRPGGALVGQVEPDTPAAKAGLRRGDVILTLNGQSVNSANDLRLRISQTAPGTTVKLGVSRDGKMQDFSVTLGELPDKVAQEGTGKESGPGGLEGVEVQGLTPDIAQQLQLPAGTKGVVVTSVDPSSPAASELNRGDVIQEVNHKPVTNGQEYRQAIAAAGNQPVLLLVNRGGATQYVVIEPH